MIRGAGLELNCRSFDPATQPTRAIFPMTIRVQSSHFVVEQLEDGWMIEAQHVTKDNKGDWLVDHDELVELANLLNQALKS